MRNLLIVALLAIGGCSWIFMEHLPSHYSATTDEPRCTATRGFAIVDGLSVAADLAVGVESAIYVSIANSSGVTAIDPTPGYAGIALALGFALLHAMSASSGAGWARECEDARYERDREVGGHPIGAPRRKDLERARRDYERALREERATTPDAGIADPFDEQR